METLKPKNKKAYEIHPDYKKTVTNAALQVELTNGRQDCQKPKGALPPFQITHTEWGNKVLVEDRHLVVARIQETSWHLAATEFLNRNLVRVSQKSLAHDELKQLKEHVRIMQTRSSKVASPRHHPRSGKTTDVVACDVLCPVSKPTGHNYKRFLILLSILKALL